MLHINTFHEDRILITTLVTTIITTTRESKSIRVLMVEVLVELKGKHFEPQQQGNDNNHNH